MKPVFVISLLPCNISSCLLQLCPTQPTCSEATSTSSVLHNVDRLLKDLRPRNRITPTLEQLRWIPIRARIAFNIFLPMYHIHSGASSFFHAGPAPGIGDIGSRLERQILGGSSFREKKYFFRQKCITE